MPYLLSLSDLNGRRVGPYQIHTECKPLKSRQGWTHFYLYLRDEAGRITSWTTPDGRTTMMPVLEGIHSRGGRWVKGWIEVGDFIPVINLVGEGLPASTLRLSEEGIDLEIFGLLSEMIPPGGHLMFAYDVGYESRFHRETLLSLVKGIPPVCTVQGELLFRSGFRLVKDWYLAEGGHEGPRKLWGEKPSCESESRAFDLKTCFQLLAFLVREPNPQVKRIESTSRRRALEVLCELTLPSSLQTLREDVVRVFLDPPGYEPLRKRAHQVCQLLKAFIATSELEDGPIERQLHEIVEASSRRFQ